jgi:peroxisomal enoyl-CoA hydratase 2
LGAPISSLGRPQWTTKGPTLPEQSVLYRLNGDYNPLHIRTSAPLRPSSFAKLMTDDLFPYDKLTADSFFTPFRLCSSAVPQVGIDLGYGGLICHGLGMYSITARALLEKLSESDPSALQAIYALFSGPITPGGQYSEFILFCYEFITADSINQC